MKEIFKEKPVVVLAVLSLVLFIFNIGSCASSYSQNSARRKEMAQRMEIEERFVKTNQEKAALLENLKAKDKEFEEDKAACQATKKALAQEQLIGQNLRDELQKVTKLKEALEDNLKEALAANKKAKR